MIVPVRQPAPRPAQSRKSLEELRREHPAMCFETATNYRLSHTPGLGKTCTRCGQPIP